MGAYDPIVLPAASTAMDWEAELGVVIGARIRNATAAQAGAAIAGYTVVNDVTARDWQRRSPQWLQGKTFEACTPVGADVVFDPITLVAYISQVITLVPGDIIATGTPGGVGHARTPPRYLRPGSEMITTIDGIGACHNVCKA